MQIRFIWGLWTALSASALGAQMPADTIRLTLSMKTGQTDNPLTPCGNELLCGRCSPFGNRGALYPAGRVSLPGSQSRFAILYVLAIQYRRAITSGVDALARRRCITRTTTACLCGNRRHLLQTVMATVQASTSSSSTVLHWGVRRRMTCRTSDKKNAGFPAVRARKPAFKQVLWRLSP